MPIFTTLTLDQQTAAAIDGQIKSAAAAQLNAYNQVRKLIFANPRYKNDDGTFNSTAVYAAFTANTSLGLTSDQLGQMARVIKASINLFQPDKITDETIPATIGF
jgi:hypothetical protein